MKNPVKEVKENLLQWGWVRLVALYYIYHGLPIFGEPYPDPSEADDDTLETYGNSNAVDVWHDMNPGELQIKINFKKINSSSDLKTYVLSEIENYLDEHPEYKKRKRVKIDEVIDMLKANQYSLVAPWPERLRELFDKRHKTIEDKKEFTKIFKAYRKKFKRPGPKQAANFLSKNPTEDNIDSHRKRSQRLLAKFDEISETTDRPFKKLTYP